MKHFYFLFIAMLTSFFSFAQVQGASKIYGYKQKVTPGTIRVDENGNPAPRKTIYNYNIYLASTTKVIPTEIWLNGEAFSVTANEVKETPVEHRNTASATDKSKILVPKTSRRVLQLIPSLNKIQKPTKKGKALSVKNELVLIYKGGSKLYFKTIAELAQLESISMQ
jgi:hypothetical protein